MCFFIPRLSGGGAERDAILLVNGLAATGTSAAIATLEADGSFLHLVDAGVPIVQLGSSQKLRLATSVPALRRLFQSAGLAAMVVSQPAAIALAVLASRLVPKQQRPKLVLREVSVPSRGRIADPYWQNRLGYRLAPLTYRAADLVVTLTEAGRRELISDFGLPGQRVVNLGTNAVLTEGMLAKIALDGGAREPNLIVSVGRLSTEKGQGILIEAFARLRQKIDARLTIVGDGPLRAALEQQTRALHVEPFVTFTGFVADPLQVVARASLFVSPSHYEGLGNALIEAMACGVQVIATDAPHGSGEILEDGRWGTLVPVGDVRALAEAMVASLTRTSAPPDARARAMNFTVARAATAFRKALVDSAILQP